MDVAYDSADALIPILRLIFTRGDFANAKWSTGRFSIPFCIIAAVWNSASLPLSDVSAKGSRPPQHSSSQSCSRLTSSQLLHKTSTSRPVRFSIPREPNLAKLTPQSFLAPLQSWASSRGGSSTRRPGSRAERSVTSWTSSKEETSRTLREDPRLPPPPTLRRPLSLQRVPRSPTSDEIYRRRNLVRQQVVPSLSLVLVLPPWH